MSYINQQLQTIPSTDEVITPEMIDELIVLAQSHAQRSNHYLHQSTLAVEDDQFSDIAFKEPVTWNLSGFEADDVKTGWGYHRLASGYDSVNFKIRPEIIRIHACYIYRGIFIVQAMRFVPDSNFHWSNLLNYRLDRPSDELPYQADWDLQFFAHYSLQSMLFKIPRLMKGGIDKDAVEKGHLHSRAMHENFLEFLKALKRIVNKPITYTTKLNEIIRI